ncbi:MAG: hypothetical protein ACRCU6_02205 [Fusobacteriaceae bacterium]
MSKKSIELGSEVKVVDQGKIYTTYDHFFKKLGFKNKNINPKNGLISGEKKEIVESTFRVFSIDHHEDDSMITLLALESIQNPNLQILINKMGVRKCS